MSGFDCPWSNAGARVNPVPLRDTASSRREAVSFKACQRLVPDFEPDEPLPVLPPLLLRWLSRLDPSGVVDVPDRLPEPLVPAPVSGEDAPGVPLPWPLRELPARTVPGGQPSELDPAEPLVPRSPLSLFLFLFLPDF